MSLDLLYKGSRRTVMNLDDVSRLLTTRWAELRTAQRYFNWATYDWWPGWLYTHKLDSPELPVSVLNDAIVVQTTPHETWALPLTTDVKKLKQALVEQLDRTHLTLPLHIAEWFGFKHDGRLMIEHAAYTSTLLTFDKKELKRKRQGIRRYELPQYSFYAFDWNSKHVSDATALIQTWKLDKQSRETSVAYTTAYEIIARTHHSKIWPDMLRGVLVYDGVKPIGFGMGASLTGKTWATLIRVCLTEYQYLSDFIFHRLAHLFSDHEIASDGLSVTYAGNEQADAQLKAYKQRYCEPGLASFCCYINSSPIQQMIKEMVDEPESA